jgi:hypothetical protein
VGRPAGACPRAVPRHQVLKHRARGQPSNFARKRAGRCAAHYRQCCAVSQSPLPADDPLPLRSCVIRRVLSCTAWPGETAPGSRCAPLPPPV